MEDPSEIEKKLAGYGILDIPQGAKAPQNKGINA
jgi:hypothetical protein